VTLSHPRNDRPSVARLRRWRRPLPAVAISVALVGTVALSATSSASPRPGADRALAKAAQPATPNLSDVSLTIGDQAGSGSEALLKAAGLLDKLPFKAHWADFTSGPPMLEAEEGGSVDVGGVGDAPPVFAAAGGAKIDIVEATVKGPDSSALVVPKGSSITSISQLKGKTIAVAQGSSADYHLLTVLEKAGLTVKEVTLEYLQPAEALAAVASGKVDAWDIWSPFTEEAVAKDGVRILVNGQGFGSNYSYEVATKAALANAGKKAAIEVYLRTLNKAYIWEKTHTSAWATTWAASTGVSLSVMQKAAVDAIATPEPISPAVITSEQGLVTAFYKAGLIPADVNFKNYSYTGFNSTLFSK
jgi:sulfonate transport system substrate-binding protein